MCICIMWLLHLFFPLAHHDDARGGGEQEREGKLAITSIELSESLVIKLQTHFRLDVLNTV